MNRDERTYDTLSEQELEKLKTKTVAVVGSGGLGGYVIEMLARIGLGKLRLIDGDVFECSNLNRQLYATEDNLGCIKVEEAKKRVAQIHTGVQVIPIHHNITKENGQRLLKGADLVMDCVDNVTTRFIMAEVCHSLNIPLIHGAVGGWHGQVMTIMPGDQGLKLLYNDHYEALAPIGAAAFIPATVASYQVAEALKYLTGKGTLLIGKMMVFDLLNNENFVVELEVDHSDDT